MNKVESAKILKMCKNFKRSTLSCTTIFYHFLVEQIKIIMRKIFIHMQIITAFATIAMAIFIGFQSRNISQQTDSIRKQTDIITQSFTLEKRPYLYIDLIPVVGPFRDSEKSGERYSFSGGEIVYKNVGLFAASDINVTAKIIDDVDDYKHDLAEWFIEEYGAFPYPTTIFPGQSHSHGYRVMLPYLEKGGMIHIYMGVRVTYKGFNENRYFYSLDYVYLVERDNNDKIIIIPLKKDTKWDINNKDTKIPEIEIDWSKYKKARRK